MMRGSTRPIRIAAMAALVGLVSCRERSALPGSHQVLDAGGLLVDPCVGDSLRPAAGAPGQGRWLYESAAGGRVVATIGQALADDRALVVTRPVEIVEVAADGDTVRFHLDAAKVSLESLPALGSLGTGAVSPDSIASSQLAATYAVSALVRLAAYEPCAMSHRGPRIRYLRRDSAGRIVTDVMLSRASDQ